MPRQATIIQANEIRQYHAMRTEIPALAAMPDTTLETSARLWIGLYAENWRRWFTFYDERLEPMPAEYMNALPPTRDDMGQT